MVDDTIPPELQDGLGWDSSFSYNGKDFATAHGYDPETRTLSLKLKRRITLPVEGEILCEDVPTKTALDRQDAAISSFLDDLAVHPRLGPLLLHPEQKHARRSSAGGADPAAAARRHDGRFDRACAGRA